MINLPLGWHHIRVGDLCQAFNGRAFKSTEWAKSGLPIIRIQNLKNQNALYNYYEGNFDQKYFIKKNDLLFAWSGTPGTSFGAHIWNGPDALLNQHIFKLVIDESIVDKKYLKLALNENVTKYIEQAQGGVGLAHITKSKFDNSTIPLPPLNEQKRIVAKIEALFSELDEALKNFRKAQETLKIYRQSLFKNAFEGELTKKWRKNFECKLINTAQVSLENNFKNLPPPPPNWIWVNLDAIGHLICGQSPSISQVNYEGKGYLYVTGPEQWNGKEIKQTKWTEFPTRIAPSNSIFITVKGAGVGKLFPGTDCVIGRDIYAFCPFKSMNHKFVFYSLLYGINKVILKAKGDIPGLSKNHILDHIIGLPPLEEQDIIVDILENKFLSIKEIEKDLQYGIDQVHLLRQSILKKAFAGELIPQDNSDVPANIFLERIKSQPSNHYIQQTKSKKKQKVSI